MTTSKRQISENGKGGLIFSQLVSPANHSALLESEQERMITVTSGQRLFVQYGRYSQLGLLVKTLLESSAWYSPAMRLKWDVRTIYSSRITYTERSKNTHSRSSAKTLSVRDMQSNRLLFRLVPSVRHTGETEYGLLPTVQTQGLKICNKYGKTDFFPLSLLPTPTAIDKGSGRMNKSRSLNTCSCSTEEITTNAKCNRRCEIHQTIQSQQSNGFQSYRIGDKWYVRNKNRPQDRWQNFPSESPLCSRHDGLPFNVADLTLSFPKWRQEAIKALGNAWVPQVAYEIFKAIEQLENINNR